MKITEPTEVELKLSFAPDDYARLLACPALARGDRAAKALLATYYDTPEQDLRRAGISLRVRSFDGRHVQTVKSGSGASGGLFIRPEWECDLPDGKPRLDMPEAPLASVLASESIARVAPLFVTRIERIEMDIDADGCRIALAIDRGTVEAGSRQEDIHEVELEWKSGDPAGLFDMARRIDRAVPLHLGVRSKAERGYLLADPHAAPPWKAEPVRIAGDADAREAFAAIAAASLRHYRLNEAQLLENGAIEAVHQARVAIRRLRSAITLFKPLFAGDPDAQRINDGLRRIGATLGDVRDIDVTLPRVAPAARERLVDARAHRLERAQAMLASAQARALLLDTVEWLALGRWRLEPADPGPAATMARTFAANALDRRLQALRKRGRHFTKLNPRQRHKVRIAAKKLRYATEFFEPLFARGPAAKQADKFRKTLERLQDQLGILNDMANAPKLLAELGLDAKDLIESAQADERHGIRRAGRLFDTLMARDRFWRT